jgi:hypothetical protein
MLYKKLSKQYYARDYVNGGFVNCSNILEKNEIVFILKIITYNPKGRYTSFPDGRERSLIKFLALDGNIGYFVADPERDLELC